MTEYEARIDEAGLNYLKALIIGKLILDLDSPAIFVENNYIISPKYIFNLRDSFLEIECLWLETGYYLDYFKLKLNLTDQPNGVQIDEYVLENKSSFKSLAYPHSSIRVSKGKILPINKILILEKMFKSGDGKETIVYDDTLVFYQENKPKFSISAHQNIYGYLEYRNNQKYMNKLIEKLNCRLIIE